MLSKLEKALGYTYRDKSLLKIALSHTSYANEVYKSAFRSYERLEFLGDSILGFVTANFLYRLYPDKLEGELSRIRADLVCEKNLAKVAQSLSLGDYLLLGNGEEMTGGRQRASITSDAVEALIAAAYLDGGFEAAKGIIMRHILQQANVAEKPRDYKTELQELVQRKKDQILTYELVSERGPDHQKEFDVCVLLNGEPVGQGTGSSKKRAEQAAAAKAILLLFPAEA